MNDNKKNSVPKKLKAVWSKEDDDYINIMIKEMKERERKRKIEQL